MIGHCINNWPYNSHGEDILWQGDYYGVYEGDVSTSSIQFEYTDAMVIDRIITNV